MPFPWKELVELARDLQHRAAAAPGSEALFRSAINRAYFGAFGQALTYAAEKHGFHPTATADDHAKLIKHFRDRPKFTGVYQRLQSIRVSRCVADYEDDPQMDWSAATAVSIVDAAWIVTALTS
jgi:hypothetical protein